MTDTNMKPEPARVFDPSKPQSDRGKAELLRQQAEAAPPPLLSSLSGSPGAIPTNFSFLPAKPSYIILGIFFCFFVSSALRFIQSTNMFLPIHELNTDGCERIHGPIGCEDIQMDPSSDGHVLFMSCDTRGNWAPLRTKDGWTSAGEAQKRMTKLTFDQQGSIYAFDPSSSSSSSSSKTPSKIEIENLPDTVTDFHPHGIHIPTPPPNESDPMIWMYIINHARNGDEIIICQIIYEQTEDSITGKKTRTARKNKKFPPRLKYVDMIRSPQMRLINDLHAIYPRTLPDGSINHALFVSNFLGTGIGDTFWNLVELGTGRPWGSVLYCMVRKGVSNSCMMAVPALSAPNGVALSKDGDRLYVALTIHMDLAVFKLPHSTHDLTPDSFPLTRLDTIYIGSGGDNIDVDTDGSLWIGSHPKPLLYSDHHEDNEKRCPSQLIRVIPPQQKEGTTNSETKDPSSKHVIEQLFMHDGQQFSAVSVGVHSPRTQQFILGAVNDDGLLMCPYKPKQQ